MSDQSIGTQKSKRENVYKNAYPDSRSDKTQENVIEEETSPSKENIIPTKKTSRKTDKIVWAVLLVCLLALVSSGCETMKGFGRDVENTGDNIQDILTRDAI